MDLVVAELGRQSIKLIKPWLDYRASPYIHKGGIKSMIYELPKLDKKETQNKVVRSLEKYRIVKYINTGLLKEASITAQIDEIGGGNSNLPGDQTGSIAIKNVEDQEIRINYCLRIERAVSRLPKLERFLIEERYMSEESEYITDYNVYSFKFDPPISAATYDKIRWKAIYKLALLLNIAVIKK